MTEHSHQLQLDGPSFWAANPNWPWLMLRGALKMLFFYIPLFLLMSWDFEKQEWSLNTHEATHFLTWLGPMVLLWLLVVVIAGENTNFKASRQWFTRPEFQQLKSLGFHEALVARGLGSHGFLRPVWVTVFDDYPVIIDFILRPSEASTVQLEVLADARSLTRAQRRALSQHFRDPDTTCGRNGYVQSNSVLNSSLYFPETVEAWCLRLTRFTAELRLAGAPPAAIPWKCW